MFDATGRALWRNDSGTALAGMRDLRAELDRTFEHFFGSPFADGARPRREGPAVNVWETDECLYAEAELPGIERSALEITVEGDELSISGARATEPAAPARMVHRERDSGRFERTLKLPYAIDADQVVARLENGVLTITLPKAKELRPRRIAVQG